MGAAVSGKIQKLQNEFSHLDFGFARVLRSDNSEQHTYNNVGPIKWMVSVDVYLTIRLPVCFVSIIRLIDHKECMTQKEYSFYSDVWSFGVTVWEILTCSAPFPG
jgi:serine/threonine protein kinase